MKLPQLRIGQIMALVVIVALDFAAVRSGYLDFGTRKLLLGHPTSANTLTKIEMLARGSLPMANILAIGLLIGLRRHGSHPSLLGFETFGALALILYTVWALFVFPRSYQYRDVVQLIQHFRFLPGVIGNRHLPSQIAVSVTFVAPQLACALLGGFLSRLANS